MGNINPAFSVIIPAYNQARFLDAAIQSALAQTCTDREIIVVNDGSTDETEAVALRYGDKIRYIFQENHGLAGARNTGMHAARGKLIALLDSDDIWLPDFLEKMAAQANAYPSASVFYCAARCIDENGRDLGQVVGYQPVAVGEFYTTLLRANFIIPSTITVRHAAAAQFNFFDPALRSLEDWDLWLRMLAGGHKFQGSPDVLARYRIHGSSLSKDLPMMQAKYVSILQKLFGPDDQAYQSWPAEKRLAYGGFHRLWLLKSTQASEWNMSGYLATALKIDPTLAVDLDLFYELALGSRPLGQRETISASELAENAKRLEHLLDDLFARHADQNIQALRGTVRATAFKALGMLAYNTGAFAMSRSYLCRAVASRPDALMEVWIWQRYFLSFLGSGGLSALRRIRRWETTR